MTQPNSFTVRGGTTDAQSEYGAGVRFYDTLSNIAQAWKAANPNDHRSLRQIQLEIARMNHIHTRNGVACTGQNIQDAVIHVDQRLVLPAGNPITAELHYDCPPPRAPRPIEPAEGAAPPPPPPAPPQAEAAPLAQFTPARAGARELENSFNMADYFFGTPPRDAAAHGKENADRLRGGALRPGQMEGQALNLRQRDDRTGARNGTDAGALPEGAEGHFFFGRARVQELLRRPSATYYVDANGNPTAPNHHYSQKLEENVGSIVDAQGHLIEARQGGALISIMRRNNPYHAGLFTDYDTARNDINQWTASAEAVNVINAYNGIETMYGHVADRFFHGTEPATTADAEHLLQLNVREALNPIVWSVSSRGVPIGNASALSHAMDEVFASPRFAALSAEDQARLRSTYQPLQGQLAHPEQLFAAAGGRAGVDALCNPLDLMVDERAQLGFINHNYNEGLGRVQGHQNDEQRIATTAATGHVYARRVMSESSRPPSETEYQIGTGAAFNTERQSAAAISTARGQVLDQMVADPALLDRWITHVTETPGALQSVTDPVFYATRKGARDNRHILGFNRDGDADHFAQQTATQLAGGGDHFRNSLNYRGNSLINSAINQVSFNLFTPGSNRNQNRGIGDGFPEAVRERWQHGTDADREQIRTAFRNIAQRSADAQRAGLGYSAASVITSLDPRLAEYRNHNQLSDNFRAIQTQLAQNGNLPLDQLVQYDDAANHIKAQVEMGTEQRVAAGENIVTGSQEQLDAAIHDGHVRINGSEVAGITALNVDAARAARGSAAALANVLSTANTPDRVPQGSVDRQLVIAGSQAEPTGFSMLVLDTLANPTLDAAARRNLRAYISTVDHGDTGHQHYADILAHHASAYAHAGNNPQARAAAEASAEHDLTAYFARPEKRVDTHTRAVSRLADLMGNDGGVSAAFNAQYRATVAQVQASGGLGLTNEQTAQISALMATAPSAAAAADALRSYLSSQHITLGDQQLAQVSALAGQNADQVRSSLNSLNAGPNGSVNAGNNGSLNANNGSLNAGPNGSLNASNGSVNAGSLNALTADQQSALAGLHDNRDTRAVLAAHTGDIHATSATWGVSRHIFLILIPPLLPHGMVPSLIPGIPLGCLDPTRPTCPIIPGLPGAPGRIG